MIVKNLKIIAKIEKKFQCKFDREHFYCTDSGTIEDNLSSSRELKDMGYQLKYLSGCFYPFLMEV
jgi:hypothetical protein